MILGKKIELDLHDNKLISELRSNDIKIFKKCRALEWKIMYKYLLRNNHLSVIRRGFSL